MHTTRATKQAKTGPEMWDLDGDGKRFAVGVNGVIRFAGSREECEKRLGILIRETTRQQQNKRLGHIFGALAMVVAAALTFVPRGTAWATSTINTTLPVQGVPYNASPIRQNFGAAANDISALQNMNAGASPPANPVLGTLWLEKPVGETTYILHIRDDRTSTWVIVAYFDSLNGLWIAPVGGGLPATILTADTTDLGSYPNTVLTVTGAGPVYSFGTSSPAGTIKVLSFSGGTNVVYNATSMVLPGAADLNTTAGDMAIAVALGSGDWQVLFFNSAALTVAQGGTGRTSLTAHAVLLGEGTSPVNFAAPGTTGYPLLSTGAAGDPAFGQLDLTVGVTGILPTPNGGTGLASPTIHNLVIGNGTSAMTMLAPGTTGFPLVSLGASLDPHYAILTTPGGGTGLATITAHAVMVGEGTANVAPVGPGTANYPLVAQGGAADPTFAPLDLSTVGVTGILPAVNGGTGIGSPTAHTLLAGNGGSAMSYVGPGTSGYPLIAAGAGADPAFAPLDLAGGGVTGKLPIANAPTGTRTPYTGNTNYCVATTGDDSDTGFSPNCWLTLQHAWDVIVSSDDLQGFSAIVGVGDGLYAGIVASGSVLGSFGPSNVTFNGNVGTPANVTITEVAGSAIVASSGAQFTIQGVKLVATGIGTGQGYCIQSSTGAYVIYTAVEFSQCDNSGVYSLDSGTTVSTGSITVSNGGQTFILASTHGTAKLDSTTVTVTGTPAFVNAFAAADTLGVVHSSATTFVGGATGLYYNASLNAVIDTAGGGGTYFPGDTPGTAATGGQYN